MMHQKMSGTNKMWSLFGLKEGKEGRKHASPSALTITRTYFLIELHLKCANSKK